MIVYEGKVFSPDDDEAADVEKDQGFEAHVPVQDLISAHPWQNQHGETGMVALRARM